MPRSRRPCVVISANSSRNLLHFRDHLLSALNDAGFLVVARAPVDDQTQELRRRNVEVWPIRLARSGANPLQDVRVILGYVWSFLRLRPIAYCGFTIKANVYGGLAARICRVPYIVNVTGLGTTFLAEGWLWRSAKILYRLGLRGAHRVFFHNADDLQTFLDARLVLKRQAELIPGSGVNLERFKPDETSTAVGGDATFLFVGRLIRDKGVHEYVEAARILRAKIPRARFQILGDLDPENRTSVNSAELESWAREGVIEHFPEREDVRPLMRVATAVVLPSYREGMSRALLEAAALGRPLIGTDVPGVRELVVEGETGALSRPQDAQSLADALERIARMPEQDLNRLGANARAKVEQRYGEDLVTVAYLKALDEIARSDRAHPRW